MGAGESKDFNRELKVFPEEEQQVLTESFRKLANAKKTVDRKSLEDLVNKLLDIPGVDALSHRICDLMTGKISTSNCVTFEGYVHLASIIIHGILDDKAGEIIYLASGKSNSATIEELQQLVLQIIHTVFKFFSTLPEAQSWSKSCSDGVEQDAHVRLATFLTSEMSDIVEDDKLCNLQTTCTWMSRCPQVNDIFDIFARKIFQLSSGKGIGFFPFCHGIPTHIYPSLLSLADVLLINSSLPVELRNEWRFLFSSRIHGESFSRLLGAIVDKGPSIIVIKDQDGGVFGGFASTSWTVSPQFTGTDKNFLFSLSPKMAVYQTTGFNDHYQYLNIQQQTFPNGLGMGGQLNYFGFWIDAEYGKGKCSPSCTTYTYRQLSAKANFLIDSVEVWAVGPEPEKDEEEERRPAGSVLDNNREGKAMLDIIGKERHSEGLREPVDEED